MDSWVDLLGVNGLVGGQKDKQTNGLVALV